MVSKNKEKANVVASNDRKKMAATSKKATLTCTVGISKKIKSGATKIIKNSAPTHQPEQPVSKLANIRKRLLKLKPTSAPPPLLPPPSDNNVVAN